MGGILTLGIYTNDWRHCQQKSPGSLLNNSIDEYECNGLYGYSNYPDVDRYNLVCSENWISDGVCDDSCV